MLIDSHCHLDYEVFKEDFDSMIERAKQKEVKYIQTICTKISEFDKIKAIIEKYDFIYGSVGNHPNEVDSQGVIRSAEIIKFANHNKIIGIGETGLDYYYQHSNKNKQIESFINHIEAARSINLPVIIHTRNAEDDTASILESELKKGSFKALIHCFTASKEFADICLDLGLYISVSGIITFKNALELQATIKNIPLNKILIETDSPYLAPVPNRGTRNEPSFVVEVAKMIAHLKNISFEEVSNATTKNFFDLFFSGKELN